MNRVSNLLIRRKEDRKKVKGLGMIVIDNSEKPISAECEGFNISSNGCQIKCGLVVKAGEVVIIHLTTNDRIINQRAVIKYVKFSNLIGLEFIGD